MPANVAPDGRLHRGAAETIARDYPQPAVGSLYRDPYNTTIPSDFDHPPHPQSAWELIRFSFGGWVRRIESEGIPVAELPPMMRGGVVAQVQPPSVVSGNIAAAGKTDRYGPFNSTAMAQSALEAFLASSVPGGVTTGQSLTGG